MPPRVDWDNFFLAVAGAVAQRATCDRKKVGAVIVVKRRIISAGYNGSMSGMPHCDEAGHVMVRGHCVRTVHSELNALALAARHGACTEGGTVYSTASPCWPCFRALVNGGIQEFVFAEDYGAKEDRDLISIAAAQLDIPFRQA